MTQSIDIVIIGGTGDLSLRKLLPALYQLHRHKLAHKVARIIATGRGNINSNQYIEIVHDNLAQHLPAEYWSDSIWDEFKQKVHYVNLDANVPEHYHYLKERLNEQPSDIQVYYLATLPSLYGSICHHLKDAGAVWENSRVVMEKPIGNDLESCKQINDEVAEVFPEEACFRIDHYLGKETVQNLLAVRFGNPLFSPIWNNQWIDNVQITVAEKIGVEGRGEFYSKVGALRDMVQNHLLQVLSLVAMEPPATLAPDDLRNEKVKVLRCLKKIDRYTANQYTVRGRYVSGAVGDQVVPGFLDELGFQEAPNTETYVAIRASIDNWRWAGVPFYLRTGKRLSSRVSEIVIEFKRQPHCLFANTANELTNKLVIRLQPEETIVLHTVNKKPGLTERLSLHPVKLHLTDEKPGKLSRYDAYERLLLDAMNGEQTLFMRRDEVETAWHWIDSIIEAWEEADIDTQIYNAGTMGPSTATGMLVKEGRNWYEQV